MDFPIAAIIPRSKYYGPDATCTIDTCDVSKSVYQYQPSIAANATFIALFALVMIIQTVQGVKWRTWGFMAAVNLGCITEIIGYAGRLILNHNPFEFSGFLIQIICITIGPVFYSAAIYITLSKIIKHLDASRSRFPPNLCYWVFITCDIISLTLQAAGGALSSTSQGANDTGVDIAIAGLVFQVFTLVIFSGLAFDYAILYVRGQHSKGLKATAGMSTRFKVFCVFLSAAIIFILIRCAYRVAELRNGYSGSLIHDQVLFIALEGVMVVLAAFCLIIAHPGPAFAQSNVAASDEIEKGKMMETP